MKDHGYERGWTRYGFDNLEFTERAIHGSHVPIGIHLAFNRGVGNPHVAFGIIPPGTETSAIGMHIHRDVPTMTDVEEWYIVIDGRGVMTFSNGDSVEGGPGDMLAVHPGTGHSFRAIGDTPCRLISITPRMFTSSSPVDEAPATFRPLAEVTEVTEAMNPLAARCRDCGAEWTRPDGDNGSDTLPVWVREHACADVSSAAAAR